MKIKPLKDLLSDEDKKEVEKILEKAKREIINFRRVKVKFRFIGKEKPRI